MPDQFPFFFQAGKNPLDLSLRHPCQCSDFSGGGLWFLFQDSQDCFLSFSVMIYDIYYDIIYDIPDLSVFL